MSMKDRLVEQGKKLASSGPVVRLVSNDGVMRVATGVMDARTRLRAAAEHASEAWNILLNGHALPNIASVVTRVSVPPPWFVTPDRSFSKDPLAMMLAPSRLASSSASRRNWR